MRTATCCAPGIAERQFGQRHANHFERSRERQLAGRLISDLHLGAADGQAVGDADADAAETLRRIERHDRLRDDLRGGAALRRESNEVAIDDRVETSPDDLDGDAAGCAEGRHRCQGDRREQRHFNRWTVWRERGKRDRDHRAEPSVAAPVVPPLRVVPHSGGPRRISGAAAGGASRRARSRAHRGPSA